MNKKILSIFALIMALSFAVSCSNEGSTGTGGNNGGGGNVGSGNYTTITDAEILTAVKNIGDKKENNLGSVPTTLFLSKAIADSTVSTIINVNGSGNVHGGTGPSIASMKKIVKALENQKITNVKEITVNTDGLYYGTGDSIFRDVSIILTANDNYQFSNNETAIIITLRIYPVQGNATDKAASWVA